MQAHWKLRRIGILSAMKIGGAISVVTGIVLGFFWAIFMVFFSSMIGMMSSKPMPAPGMSVFIFIPLLTGILYGFFGVFMSFLLALLYNIAAGFLGGLEFEVDYRYDFERKEEPADYYGSL